MFVSQNVLGNMFVINRTFRFDEECEIDYIDYTSAFFK